jgi:phosphatidylglycerophosphatase A
MASRRRSGPGSSGKPLRDRFILCLASAGYIGYFPYAPGTAGTAAGILVYWVFSFFPAPVYLVGLAAAFLLAWWTAARAGVILAQKDSPRVVIDEVVGYLITMTFLPRSSTMVVGGFIFFRVLDIIKPPPVKFIDRQMQGGLAVVLDDAVAGMYSNFLLHAIHHWYPHLLLVGRWLNRLS